MPRNDHLIPCSGPTKTLLLALAVMLLSSCSGNKLLITTAYNRADNSSASRFYQYANFSSLQRKQIKASVDQLHWWHRKTELPLYLNVLTEIQQSLSNNKPLNNEKISRWSEEFDQLRDHIDICNPLLQSAEFMRSLSDEQVLDIQQRFEQLEKKSVQRRARYSEQEQHQRRLKRTTKNIKYLGVRLKPNQIEMLNKTLEETESIRKPWDAYWKQWKLEFIATLELREQQDFPNNLREMFEALSNMSEREFPEVIQANRDRWIALMLELERSLDDQQRSDLLRVLGNLSESLEKLISDPKQPDTSAAFTAPQECLAMAAV